MIYNFLTLVVWRRMILGIVLCPALQNFVKPAKKCSAICKFLFAIVVMSGPIKLATAQTEFDPFPEITGPAQVVSGDVLAVAGEVIRIYGIDAPDMGQTCYNARGVAYDCGMGARNFLQYLVGDNEVTCTLYNELAGEMQNGTCRIGSTDLAAVMVVRGWAFSYRSISNRYEQHEALAQSRRAGFWSGRAQRPWIWRNLEVLGEE